MDKQNVDEAPTDVQQTDVETSQEQREVRLDADQPAEWGDQTPQEEKSEEVEEQPEKDEEVVEMPAPVEQPKTLPEQPTNPGEYVPNDYSFDFELEGKSIKINSVEEAEKFAEDNAEKFTAKELLAFVTKSNKMATNLERDKEKFDKKAEEYKKFQDDQAAEIEFTNSLVAEVEYLISKGKMPVVPEEFQSDWTTHEARNNPAIQKHMNLVNYFKNESAVRVKAGLKPMTSMLEAYNSWQLEQKSDNESSLKKQQAEDRKSRSGKVAGVSPKPVNIAPKGVAVGRVIDLSMVDGF